MPSYRLFLFPYRPYFLVIGMLIGKLIGHPIGRIFPIGGKLLPRDDRAFRHIKFSAYREYIPYREVDPIGGIIFLRLTQCL